MKKKNGFTLIELLAVIVILAIIALIATPIVLSIVEKTRKSAFENTAYGLLEAAKLQYTEAIIDGAVAAKEYDFDDVSGTSLKFTGSIPEGGKVVVDVNGNVAIAIYDLGYCALKGSNDSKIIITEYEAGKCIIPDIAKNPLISLKGDREITLYQGDTYIDQEVEAKTLDGTELTYSITIVRDGIIVDSVDTKIVGEYTITYTTEISNDKIATETRTVTIQKAICRRATTLHTEECTRTSTSGYCSGAGYTASGSKGTTTITYGNLGTGTTLTSGDAFDCDVNGDGTYDAATERFYYVSDLYNTTTKTFDSDYATLIYYNNTKKGVADNTSASAIAYDSSNRNYVGPVTAKTNLPTTAQWSNIMLKTPTRAILNTNGSTTAGGVKLPTAFDYSGYAARMITAQEINLACGITVGSYPVGELDTCNYFMENTSYSSSSIISNGHYIESPYSGALNYVVFMIYSSERSVRVISADSTNNYGVRPVIEVLKTELAM